MIRSARCSSAGWIVNPNRLRGLHVDPRLERSLQVQQRDRAVVVLLHPLMRQRHPRPIRRSYPPLVGSVRLDPPAVVAGVEGHAIDVWSNLGCSSPCSPRCHPRAPAGSGCARCLRQVRAHQRPKRFPAALWAGSNDLHGTIPEPPRDTLIALRRPTHITSRADRDEEGGSYVREKNKSHQRGPVSRVLSPGREPGETVISLGRRLPDASSGHTRERHAGRASPVLADGIALLLGLAPGGVYRAGAVTRVAGELLPHRFTLTARCWAAVCFLWHWSVGLPPLAVSQHPALRSPDFPPARVAPRRRPSSLLWCESKSVWKREEV
jgi:hypothetical protein